MTNITNKLKQKFHTDEINEVIEVLESKGFDKFLLTNTSCNHLYLCGWHSDRHAVPHDDAAIYINFALDMWDNGDDDTHIEYISVQPLNWYDYGSELRDGANPKSKIRELTEWLKTDEFVHQLNEKGGPEEEPSEEEKAKQAAEDKAELYASDRRDCHYFHHWYKAGKLSAAEYRAELEKLEYPGVADDYLADLDAELAA